MKTIVAFAALLAVVAAGVLPYPNEVVVVNENLHNNIGLDGYQYNYELSDGSKREESAQVELGRTAEEATLRVRGSYSFVADDGQTYTVNYVADETGFHPEGAHLPALPPLPKFS